MGNELVRSIPTDVPVGSNAKTSGTNAAVAITFPAIATRAIIIDSIVWSYGGTPTGGKLTVAHGATTVLEVDITASGPGALPLNLSADINEQVVVTLGAGGSGVVGKLNVFAHSEPLSHSRAGSTAS